MALEVEVVEGSFQTLGRYLRTTSDLSLARNLFGLGLTVESNHIYQNHVMAIIIIDFSFRLTLSSNIL